MVLINADDFGLSESVNRAIVACFKKGLINSTSLMVNMPCAESAVLLAKKEGFFDKVGLHFNLTQGKPLSKECAMSNLCTNGELNNYIRKPVAHFFVSAKNKRAIKAEFEQQLKKYLTFGFKLKHVDSHHHVHAVFPVFNCIKQTIPNDGSVMIRLSRNINLQRSNFIVKAYKSNFNKVLRKSGYKTTTFFGSVNDYLHADPNDVKTNDIEIMTHPCFNEKNTLFDGNNAIEKLEKLILELNENEE